MTTAVLNKDYQDWYFTFGHGHKQFGQYVIINGTFSSAREEMFRHFGPKWCWQYSNKEKDTIIRQNLQELKL